MPGAPKKFEDAELEILLNKIHIKHLKEFSTSLNIDESTVSKQFFIWPSIYCLKNGKML